MTGCQRITLWLQGGRSIPRFSVYRAVLCCLTDSSPSAAPREDSEDELSISSIQHSPTPQWAVKIPADNTSDEDDSSWLCRLSWDFEVHWEVEFRICPSLLGVVTSRSKPTRLHLLAPVSASTKAGAIERTSLLTAFSCRFVICRSSLRLHFMVPTKNGGEGVL
ncbi:hypothetical protein M3J09_007008 [Ascochyta lentis]